MSTRCGALPPPPVASPTTSQVSTCRVSLDAMPMHLALLPLPHVLAVRAPRVRAEAVDPPKLHLRDHGHGWRTGRGPGLFARSDAPRVLRRRLRFWAGKCRAAARRYAALAPSSHRLWATCA